MRRKARGEWSPRGFKDILPRFNIFDRVEDLKQETDLWDIVLPW
jgi:hypothetical protein